MIMRVGACTYVPPCPPGYVQLYAAVVDAALTG